MKKKIFLAMLMTVVALATIASVSQKKKDVTGEWKYEVPSAPYGYQKGVLVINEKEGNLAGEVKFEDGYKIELKNVSYEEGTLKCGLYVESDYVTVNAKIEGKTLKGSVKTPEGEMNITAEKVK